MAKFDFHPLLGLRQGGGRGGAIQGKEGIKFCHLTTLYKIVHDPVLPFSDLDTAVLPVPATAAPQVHRPLLQFPNFARQDDFRRARKQAIQNSYSEEI